jgi:aminotransferase
MISVFGSKVGKEEIANVTACMESQWMGFGKKVNEFEQKFSDHFSIPHFAMVDSGSNALYMACVLLDLPKGSEIILPSFTWVSCAQAIIMAGHKPVFCDVDLNTFNVTDDLIGSMITKNTGAIMIVHYAGKPVNMNPVMELGLPVIEDAAHAVNSTYYGKPCGTIGDIGIYSFDAVKNLTTGEGGGITTKNKKRIDRAKMLRYCGIGSSGFEAASSRGNAGGRWWEYNILEPFIKMLPTNIAASIGIAQLDKLNELQNYRQKIWHLYTEELTQLQWLVCPPDAEKYETHSYFTYVVRVKGRDRLAKYLFDKGIYTTLRYHPLHLNKLYHSDAKLPNCEQLNEDALSIPLHPNLSMEEVSYIIDAIKSFDA